MWRALAILATAGCYGPSVHAGSPCSEGEPCPDGLVCSPASQTCELTAVDGSVHDGRTDAPPDVQTSAFRYRRRLTIHNGSAMQLPSGFAIRVKVGATLATLVAAGKVNADYSDLRVIGDVAGERDRIVDPATGPAPPAITFALAQPLDAGATTLDYALYYGDPGAGPAPANGAAVFTIYDDFTAGIAPFWATNDGPTATGGQLILRANHLDAIATTAATDKLPLTSAVELVARVPAPTSDPTVQTDGTFYYWFGYQKTGTFTPVSDPWVLWIARGKSEIGPEQKSPVGCEAGCEPTTLTQNTSPHYFAIERDPAQTRFTMDTSATVVQSVTNSEDYSVMVRNFMATSDLQVD
ncbi:MAG TPA: hypothetical protein VIV58_15590, partial [Kofleriaceae bacterium]